MTTQPQSPLTMLLSRHTRRRVFITLLGGAAAWPLAARAQQASKVWRIGFIAHTYERFYDALFEGLRERGYVEGQNVMFERRYAEGRVERFKEFAAELVRLKADIIIVVTTPAALAVKNATTTPQNLCELRRRTPQAIF
jgi:putative ABC transport system substrate-binding protein